MEMEKSIESGLIFTLNDFPTEIIERFLPDLRPRTISTLRLVSPRFRDVFTSDRYFRNYLFYNNRPEFYLEDLEEIGEARDCWRRCLEAEKKRLDNWRHGRATNVYSLRVPKYVQPTFTSRGFKFIEWHGAVGEGNVYWVMCELKRRKIFLANVTNDPVMTVVDVSCYTPKTYAFAHLLADQIAIDCNNGALQVFDILNDGAEPTLKHIFTIESPGTVAAYVSGMSSAAHAYRNLYASHNRNGVMRVWDLKTSVVENFVLNELLPPNRVDGGEPKWVDLLGTEFPYVLATLEVKKKKLYLAVDLERKRIACCVARENHHLNLWFVKGHELLMDFRNEQETDVCIYGLRSSCSETRLLFRQTLQGPLTLQTHSMDYEPPWLVSSVEDNYQTISLRRVDEPEITTVIDELQSIEFRTIVGPFLLVEYSHPSLIEEDRLLTLNKDGDQVFDWAHLIRVNVDDVIDLCLPYVSRLLSPRFRSLSKCVVQNVRGDTLYICNF